MDPKVGHLGNGRNIKVTPLAAFKKVVVDSGSEITWLPEAELEAAGIQVFKKDLQYLYKDLDNVYFMNPITFEQISIPLKIVGNDVFYLKEGESCNISFLGDEALSINLPPKMIFTVFETAPGVKGNSATNVFKDATLENGQIVKVPLFIKIGDKVKVDTRTGAYSEKAQ